MAERPTIGLVLGQMEEIYQQIVWPGVLDGARERGVNLLCFAGRPLRSPYGFEAQGNALYDLVGRDLVDGLIVITGTLGNYVPLEELEQFCRRFEGIPSVAIAVKVGGMPTLTVDNRGGMYAVVSHLIEVHGHRRIAFIRGPEGHAEAEARYQAYRDALRDHGIEFDPDLIAPGNFTLVKGYEAIRTLVDERGVQFDALVATNDTMAVGAIEALQERGYHIPTQVAVAGFDDLPESRAILPPLTTARQPIYRLGRESVDLVLRLLAGEPVPDEIEMQTELVVRRSCGCLPESIREIPLDPLATPSGSWEEALATARGQIAGALDGEWDQAEELAAQVVEGWRKGMESGNGEEFLWALDDALQRTVRAGKRVVDWQRAIARMRRVLYPSVGDRVTWAENGWHQAFAIVNEVARDVQSYQLWMSGRRAEMLHKIAEHVLATFDLESLRDLIPVALERVGLRSAYVVLYEEPGAGVSEQARLFCAWRDGQPVASEQIGVPFPARKLLPDGVLPADEAYHLVVEPLYFSTVLLGHALFSLDVWDGLSYEALRTQISTTLMGAHLRA